MGASFNFRTSGNPRDELRKILHALCKSGCGRVEGLRARFLKAALLELKIPPALEQKSRFHWKVVGWKEVTRRR